MKKVILLSVLIAASPAGFAQKQWVGVSLHGFSSSSNDAEWKNSGFQTAKGSSLVLYPSISYNRFIGKDWGLGLEVGYKSIDQTVENGYTTTNDVANSYNQRREKSYRISPSLFQNYVWKKYRGVASLAIPIELRRDILQENTLTTKTPQIITETKETRTAPDELSVGALVNLGVQRQLAGGLYFGPQLGFGINRTSSNGTTTNTTSTGPLAGPKTVSVQSEDSRSVLSYFTVFPSLNLCYYF